MFCSICNTPCGGGILRIVGGATKGGFLLTYVCYSTYPCWLLPLLSTSGKIKQGQVG